MSGEGSRIFEEEERVRVVVDSVSDGGSRGFDGPDMVAAVVLGGRAKVKCSVTVVGPSGAILWSEVGGA